MIIQIALGIVLGVILLALLPLILYLGFWVIVIGLFLLALVAAYVWVLPVVIDLSKAAAAAVVSLFDQTTTVVSEILSGGIYAENYLVNLGGFIAVGVGIFLLFKLSKYMEKWVERASGKWQLIRMIVAMLFVALVILFGTVLLANGFWAIQDKVRPSQLEIYQSEHSR